MSGSSAQSEDRVPLTPTVLRNWAASAGLSAVRTQRILHGVYRLGSAEFSELPRVRRAVRDALGASFLPRALARPEIDRSADGTAKLLFQLQDGSAIETVLIPDGRRQTVCVSSQVGCAMGCDFCATAKLGLRRDLSAAEILDQLQAARRLLAQGERITNVVFMGMGEPLHNYAAVLEAIEAMRADWGFGLSSRRITVSTVGLLPQLKKLAAETDVAIAVSLTATNDDLRDRLMPVNRRYPLRQVLDTCRGLPIAQRRRITFEYVLLRGVNDRDEDAVVLASLLHGIRAKVNLIPFNPHGDSPYQRPSAERVRAFQDRLLEARVSATVRKTRGDSVRAACGQLAALGSSPSPTA